MSSRPRTQRHQSLLDRLTALLPSSLTSRRQREDGRALAALAITNDPHASQLAAEQCARLNGIRGFLRPGTTLEPAPTPVTAEAIATAAVATASEEPDPDAPTALLLPGMSELTINAVRNLNPAPVALCDLRVASPDFISKPPRQPNLFLTVLPPEIHFLIFDAPQLSLFDLLALRNTCRALRRIIPIGALERQLKVQNYAGWSVVFEMNGHKYPGTTYGNRRLCGRCVVPKTRGHLIVGSAVRAYLTRRGAVGGGLDEVEEESWPEERGMCFLCLWTVLATTNAGQVAEKRPALKPPVGTEGPGNVGRYQDKTKDQDLCKLAAISPQERFLMLDGTIRKTCDQCAKDIHENAVPCPHCTDFSEWCKARHKR